MGFVCSKKPAGKQGQGDIVTSGMARESPKLFSGALSAQAKPLAPSQPLNPASSAGPGGG